VRLRGIRNIYYLRLDKNWTVTLRPIGNGLELSSKSNGRFEDIAVASYRMDRQC